MTSILREMFPISSSSRAKSGADELTNSLIFPMINEAMDVLSEGMAQRPEDIDSCLVHGYNFPRTKGGPLHWADEIGLDVVHATLKNMNIRPAELLVRCVEQKTTLKEFWRKNGGSAWAKARGKTHPSRSTPLSKAAHAKL